MKETISKVKRQPSEWDIKMLSNQNAIKMIANEATDKELIKNIQAAHSTQYHKNK